MKELARAETEIIKYLQRKYFSAACACLENSLSLPNKNFLCKLAPYIDDNSVMRAGGRLRFSDIPNRAEHPIILPKESAVPRLIVEEYHKACGHLGRETLLSQVRSKYFIVGCSNLVKRVLRECFICRKVQGKPSTQFMSDLPSDKSY